MKREEEKEKKSSQKLERERESQQRLCSLTSLSSGGWSARAACATVHRSQFSEQCVDTDSPFATSPPLDDSMQMPMISISSSYYAPHSCTLSPTNPPTAKAPANKARAEPPVFDPNTAKSGPGHTPANPATAIRRDISMR